MRGHLVAFAVRLRRLWRRFARCALSTAARMLRHCPALVDVASGFTLRCSFSRANFAFAVYTWFLKNCAGCLVWSSILLTLAGGAWLTYLLLKRVSGQMRGPNVQALTRALLPVLCRAVFLASAALLPLFLKPALLLLTLHGVTLRLVVILGVQPGQRHRFELGDVQGAQVVSESASGSCPFPDACRSGSAPVNPQRDCCLAVRLGAAVRSRSSAARRIDFALLLLTQVRLDHVCGDAALPVHRRLPAQADRVRRHQSTPLCIKPP